MRFIAKTIVTLALGVALGLGATWGSIERGYGFGGVRAGPWVAWPAMGTEAADPYTRAALARTGELPLGSAVGLRFIARIDSEGRALDPACDYLIAGETAAARYWSLAAMDPRGGVIDNRLQQYGLTSSEIVRADDNSFQITVARDARPGNWLMLGADTRFVLVLRLYDTVASATALSLDPTSLPAIRRERCA